MFLIPPRYQPTPSFQSCNSRRWKTVDRTALVPTHNLLSRTILWLFAAPSRSSQSLPSQTLANCEDSSTSSFRSAWWEVWTGQEPGTDEHCPWRLQSTFSSSQSTSWPTSPRGCTIRAVWDWPSSIEEHFLLERVGTNTCASTVACFSQWCSL